MFQRIWGFVKRHRKKFIFSAAFFGGTYVAWRVLLPRLMQHLMERALKSMEDEGGLEKLLGLTSEGDEESRKQAAELKKRQDFEHKQQVSDRHVRKSLDAINARHTPSFSLDECSAKLAEAKTKEDKMNCLQAFQAECLARTASAVYTLEILLLLHRVEFNIVGREIAAASSAGKKFGDSASSPTDGNGTSEEDAEAQALFLASTRYVQEEGLERLASSVKSAVKACSTKSGLSPGTAVTAESLQRFFIDVFREADAELLLGGKGAATLLPESLDTEVAKEREKVKRLLDEARDYLESPQFLDVFQAISSNAAEHLAASLGDGAADPASAPLATGKSCQLAKLFAPLIQNSQATLSGDDRGGFVERFAKDEKVTKLCEALYFEDAKK